MRLAIFSLVPVALLACTTVPHDGEGGQGSSSSSDSTGETSATTTNATSGSMDASSSSGGGMCDLVEGAVIPESCGVFVKGSAVGGDGSKASPYGSIAAAIAGSPDKDIYVCGGDTFTGSVALGAASLRGGMDCAGWAFAKANPRPKILGDANAIAVASDSMGARTIDSVDIESPAATLAGASSIALVATNGSLGIQRSDIRANAGMAGAPGTSGPAQGPAAGVGHGGNNACGATNPTPPGAEVDQTCSGLAMASVGGSGGAGNNAFGADAAPGFAGNLGAKGIGEAAVGWSCAVDGNGHSGAAGMPGMVGLAGTSRGTLDVAGFTPAEGGDGEPGLAAQGGGGGGGAKGPIDCNSMVAGNQSGPGASGGSGGAGGCGGLPGEGGQGGGSSFAIVSIGSSLTLVGATTLQSAAGGTGGDGGMGQLGASGGMGGSGGQGVNGSKNACRGGDGGLGGNGGGGGGGRGGHSASIVFLGTAPVTQNGVFAMPPTAASGGAGKGNGAVAGNDGLPGDACKVLDFEADNCIQ